MKVRKQNKLKLRSKVVFIVLIKSLTTVCYCMSGGFKPNHSSLNLVNYLIHIINLMQKIDQVINSCIKIVINMLFMRWVKKPGLTMFWTKFFKYLFALNFWHTKNKKSFEGFKDDILNTVPHRMEIFFHFLFNFFMNIFENNRINIFSSILLKPSFKKNHFSWFLKI